MPRRRRPSSSRRARDCPEPDPAVPIDDLRRCASRASAAPASSPSPRSSAPRRCSTASTCSGLDQIGLSQKAGPVVSATCACPSSAPATPIDWASSRPTCCWRATSSSPRRTGRLVCSPDRTTVVGSIHADTDRRDDHPPRTPTADPGSLESLIATETRPDAQYWADAEAITTALFGDAVMANMFVVGMAVQSGLAPCRSVSAVKRGHRAQRRRRREEPRSPSPGAGPRLHFRTRSRNRPVRCCPFTPARPRRRSRNHSTLRCSAASPTSRVETTYGRRSSDSPGIWLDSRTTRQPSDSSQHSKLSTGPRARWPRISDSPRRWQSTCTSSPPTRTSTRSRGSMLLDDGLADAKALANGGTITWKLHPPMLRALGMHRKMSITSKAAPAFRSLAAGKRLTRNTAGPVRRAAVRRLERELVAEYRDVIDQLVAGLTAENLPVAIEIASLPDQVRGYEDLKVRRAAEYRAELADALDVFRSRR